MLKTLIQNWWLLALRGALALLLAAAALLTRSSAETFTLREFAMKGLVVFFGMLALAAGACTVAAGIWNSSKGKWWLLVVDGVVLSVAGVVLIIADRFSFRTVTHLIVVFAVVVGMVELATAQKLRRHLPDEWLLGFAGIASIAFAVTFLLIKPEEPGSMFTWLGSYAGFSAFCMWGVALRLRSLRASIHEMAQSAPHSS
jgi:uncharacterized membrane protein HdeD (DUF308 family)